MAANAFISFFDKADGESIVKGKEKWVEITGWDWEVEANTSWLSGAGASVGKPTPGSFHFEHRYDMASNVLLGYLCNGKAFPKVELQVMKSVAQVPQTYFTMIMEGVFITKVSNSGTEDGSVRQSVELVFKTVRIDYRPQSPTGTLGTVRTYNWDIPAGRASPSA